MSLETLSFLRGSCVASAVLAAAVSAFAAPPDDPEGRALLERAQRVIADYHAGNREAEGKGVVRVVYFRPNDRAPLPDHAERIDRALGDISDFYRDGLRRLGVALDAIPFERKDGRIALHVVTGKHPASAYNHDSGTPIADEVRAALAPVFDLDREHVLILHALSRQEPDGRYVIDASYYGSGSHRAGICHAPDCELLDPRLLTDTKRKIVFTHLHHSRREETVAAFNSMYLGGIAHELGHAFGLFHDNGMAGEKGFGSALMGSGNLVYRADLRGGNDSAFLSRVTALHLAAHPLVTGSNRGRQDEIGGGIEELTFASDRGMLRIGGRVEAGIPAYAVVAYVWPSHASDHSSSTFPVIVSDKNFALELPGLQQRASFMRLVSLHVNGGASWADYRFGFDAAGHPRTPQKIEWPWIVQRAEQAVSERRPEARTLLFEQAGTQSFSAEEQRMLGVLRGILEPPPILEAGEATGGSVFLSDARWLEAEVGWGQLARNHYWFDEQIQDGVFLMLGGQFFDKGLYAHANSRFVFPLDGKWETFTATVGLRDGAPETGSAVFLVRGDGRELYRSPVLNVGARDAVTVSVAGVQKLELIAEGGEGHNQGSWTIWAEPKVSR